MIKSFSFFAVFLSLTTLYSCSSGKLYENNKEHVKLGQTFVGKFYKEVSKKNFDKAAFDDSGSFEFMFIWELRNELKNNLVEIRLTKQNISPVELANLKIERVR